MFFYIFCDYLDLDYLDLGVFRYSTFINLKVLLPLWDFFLSVGWGGPENLGPLFLSLPPFQHHPGGAVSQPGAGNHTPPSLTSDHRRPGNPINSAASSQPENGGQAGKNGLPQSLTLVEAISSSTKRAT